MASGRCPIAWTGPRAGPVLGFPLVMSRSRFRILVLSSVLALVGSSLGCSSTKELDPKVGPNGAVQRRYRVECIDLEQCKAKAAKVCGSPYEIVSEWHNPIPESDLPGLNEESRPKDTRDFNHQTLPNATGIESKEPMPLSSIEVACNG
jgi:hypothetical protein